MLIYLLIKEIISVCNFVTLVLADLNIIWTRGDRFSISFLKIVKIKILCYF